jgi:broad specificity phosphatase PhoE
VARLVALVLSGFGLGAYIRSRRRRRLELEASPADELRSKLAESRAAELEPPTAPEPEADVEERRRDVHDRARSAIDDLSST